MKFKDTLATLQYMGGTMPNHISMLLYAGYAWEFYYKDIDCNEIRAREFPNLPVLKLDSYKCIYDMIITHALCIALYFLGKLLSKNNDYSSYFKTLLIAIRIFIYFAGFMGIVLGDVQIETKDTYLCAHMSNENFDRITGLSRFVSTEVALFFGYVIALVFYIMWTKVYVILKEKFTNPEELNNHDEDEPFW